MDAKLEPKPLPFGPIPSPIKRSALGRRLVVLAGVVVIVCGFGGYSSRLSVDRAKMREARRFLKHVGEGAQAAYARDGKLCASEDFACLGVDKTSRKYHYTYEATDTSFTATGTSYLREDERRYRLRVTGRLAGGKLLVNAVERVSAEDP